MLLPKEISPNPLVSSTIELRFISELLDSDILANVFPVFSKDFPNLTEGQIPKEIKKQEPQLKYSPDYILKNEKFSISFSNCVLSFENITDYPLWGNYFPFIKENLLKFLSLGIVKKIDRVGLRYASILEDVLDPNEVLKYIPVLNIDGYEQEFAIFRTDIKKGIYNLHLQIAKKAQVQKGSRRFSGFLIDIDASISNNIEMDNTIYDLISNLHQEQKKLFFDLLKPEFIKKLNPKY